eukprot:1155240-Pelagomonas_calceolata.AAC.5
MTALAQYLAWGSSMAASWSLRINLKLDGSCLESGWWRLSSSLLQTSAVKTADLQHLQDLVNAGAATLHSILLDLPA